MIPPTSLSGSSVPTAIAGKVAEETRSVLSSDFETFLQMLTAQAENQDPLEPINSSEYAAQLAQFSMVEQQVLSNDLLTALGSQFGQGTLAQLSGWIGMEARTTAPVPFDGEPVTVTPKPAAAADSAELVVYDVEGNEVQRLPLPLASEPVLWAGVYADGSPLPSDSYRFEVESRAQGESIETTRAEAYARITEARLEGSETQLILQGGVLISAAEVTGLREPGLGS